MQKSEENKLNHESINLINNISTNTQSQLTSSFTVQGMCASQLSRAAISTGSPQIENGLTLWIDTNAVPLDILQ